MRLAFLDLGLLRRARATAAAFLMVAGVSCRVCAQTPAVTAPPELQGRWEALDHRFGPAYVMLSGNSAPIFSEARQLLGYLAGVFSATGPMELGVWWDMLAFQADIDGLPLPSSAWPGAVKDEGDPKYPGLIHTRMVLRYDAAKDEMAGDYWDLKIIHDLGKYEKTESSRASVRFTRANKPITGEAGGWGTDRPEGHP